MIIIKEAERIYGKSKIKIDSTQFVLNTMGLE